MKQPTRLDVLHSLLSKFSFTAKEAKAHGISSAILAY
ncbi:unknown protein [Parachlamydia acanthamoebae UV-7]|jgi:hypothetical protein|uniref:Uncharacterized protein n=1 Tax=Parachlamydia acanthamoebae (strain UV7) TaxID=765952 RepID=F8KZG3_PARAV|nr:unknown protein [Parachlamydia acanthamoebae UV-7]